MAGFEPRPPAPKSAPAGRLTELHVVQCGAYLGLCWLDVAQHRVMAVPAGPHSGSHQCCPGTRLLPIELNLEFEARSRYSGSQRPSRRRPPMLSRSPNSKASFGESPRDLLRARHPCSDREKHPEIAAAAPPATAGPLTSGSPPVNQSKLRGNSATLRSLFETTVLAE